MEAYSPNFKKVSEGKHRTSSRSTTRWIVLLIIALVGGLWWYYRYNLSTPRTTHEQLTAFTVEKGSGSGVISRQLADEGFIKSPLAFQYYVWAQETSSLLKDGEYYFGPEDAIKDIAEALFRGPSATGERNLTFIEGWTNEQIADYLEQQGIATRQEFFAIVQKKQPWWDDYSFLDDRPSTVDLEGYLFPDTYRVFVDASVENIVRKMLNTFDARLTQQMRDDIAASGRTIHEVLTLASIVEREVRTDESRAMVADVFYKRLEIGMALQSDATVNYITGKKTPRASLTDLQEDSLYNTYKYPGLPPGPISNPSLSAIRATIYPKSNPYYYFLTTPDGQVIYSETHDQHVAAKQKYY